MLFIISSNYIFTEIHCYHHWEILESVSNVLNQYLTHLQPYYVIFFDYHARLCGFEPQKYASGDSNLMFHLINLIQHSLLTSL